MNIKSGSLIFVIKSKSGITGYFTVFKKLNPLCVFDFTGDRPDVVIELSSIKSSQETLKKDITALKRSKLINHDEIRSAISDNQYLVGLFYEMLYRDIAICRKNGFKITISEHKKIHSLIQGLMKTQKGITMPSDGERTADDLNEQERTLYVICEKFQMKKTSYRNFVQRVDILNDHDWLPAVNDFINEQPYDRRTYLIEVLDKIVDYVFADDSWWNNEERFIIRTPALIVKHFEKLAHQSEQNKVQRKDYSTFANPFA